MAITGTGTGPFTITGTETSSAIFTYVTGQNSANATKLAGAQYRWACVFNLGGLWNPIEEQHEFNATFTVQNGGLFRSGEFDSVTGLVRRGCFIRHNGAGPQIQSGGTYELNASVGFANSAGSNSGAFILRDTACNFRDSMNGGGSNSYRRVSIGHNGSVGFKYNAAVSIFSDVKIAGVTFGIQPQTGTPGVFTDTVFDNCVWDTVPNGATENLTFLGLYDGEGVPKNTLKIGAERNGGVERIAWRYNLAASFAGGGLADAAVTIRDAVGVVHVTTTTNSQGVIPQQQLERVVYTGLANRSTGTAFAGTTTPKFPHTVRIRKLGILPIEIVKRADSHSADGVLATADPSVKTTNPTVALAISGIALNPTAKTVTLSESRTDLELLTYISAWLSLAVNHNVAWFVSYISGVLNISDWTLVGAEFLTGKITTTSATANGTISNLTVNGNVSQATPTNLSNVVITGTLTYNTNSNITITITDTTINTVINNGTGIVTINKVNSTIANYTDAEINFIDSTIAVIGADTVTFHPTANDRDLNINASGSFTSSYAFKFGSTINGSLMSDTLYLRCVAGGIPFDVNKAIVLGDNLVDLGQTAQLASISDKLSKVKNNTDLIPAIL